MSENESTIKDLEARVKALEKEIDGLKKDLANRDKTIVKLTADLDSSKKRIQLDDDQIESYEVRYEEVMKEKSEIESRLNRINVDLDVAIAGREALKKVSIFDESKILAEEPGMSDELVITCNIADLDIVIKHIRATRGFDIKQVAGGLLKIRSKHPAPSEVVSITFLIPDKNSIEV